MSLSRTQLPNYTGLAASLLAAFKSWARIDHTDDDDALSLLLAGAIGQLEKQFDVAIAAQSWAWTPVTSTTAAGSNRLACACGGVNPRDIPIPVRGVQTFTATRGEPPVDVSSEFHLSGATYWGDFGEQFMSSDAGAHPGDAFTLDAGTVDLADLPPALTSVIFRYSLFMWENRESATDKSMAEVPDWITRAWSVYWTPRA